MEKEQNKYTKWKPIDKNNDNYKITKNKKKRSIYIVQ